MCACVYQSQDQSSLRCNNGRPVEFSWALPAHSRLLAARCQPAQRFSFILTHRRAILVCAVVGADNPLQAPPQIWGRPNLAWGPLWGGEGKEQSLLGTEMGWVRFVLKVQPLLLIKRLIFNLGIQSLPWRKTRTDLVDSFKRSTVSCGRGREHAMCPPPVGLPRRSWVLLSRQEAVGRLQTPPRPPPPSSLSLWMLSCSPLPPFRSLLPSFSLAHCRFRIAMGLQQGSRKTHPTEMLPRGPQNCQPHFWSVRKCKKKVSSSAKWR